MIANTTIPKPSIIDSDQSGGSQNNNNMHGFVINKTQEYLKSKGFGWLMETDHSSEMKENLLGGETEPQPSILEELDIDPNEIFFKIKRVILPMNLLSTNNELTEEEKFKFREGDTFWGPFFILLIYSFLVELTYLQLKVITWMFVIWFIGSLFIWFLVRLFTPASMEEVNQQQLNQQQQVKKESDNDLLISDLPPSFETPTISNLGVNNGNNNNINEPIIDISYSHVMSFVGYSLIPHVLILLVLLLLKLIIDKYTFYYLSIFLNIISVGWSTMSCLFLLTVDNYYLKQKKNLLFTPILLLNVYFYSLQTGV
ncbi:hypothetical protein ABK040_008698 [Willaertia magna]